MYLLAIVGYKIVYECIDDSKKRIRNAKIAYVFLICLPTVLLNSSYWGQCDSIYSFFVLLSIYYLIKEDIIYSFIFLGVAFSFKLQFIFILPVFVILMFLGKKIKIYYFLIIPITNFIMCIPAYIVGGSPLYTYKTYFLQTKEYGLSAPTTNIYNFLSQDNNIIYAGVIISLLLFLILLIYYYLNDTLFDKNKIIDLSLLSVMMCYFFLPSMHERYSYLIDVISVIWIFVRGKYIFIPIIVNLCSLSLYLEYLIGFKLTLNYHKELAILFFICVISMLFIINNTMREKYKM